MKYGMTLFLTDQSIGPAEMAAAAEERGFESVWFAEHSPIPMSPATQGSRAFSSPCRRFPVTPLSA